MKKKRERMSEGLLINSKKIFMNINYDRKKMFYFFKETIISFTNFIFSSEKSFL